jgi:hypothetical protein
MFSACPGVAFGEAGGLCGYKQKFISLWQNKYFVNPVILSKTISCKFV